MRSALVGLGLVGALAGAAPVAAAAPAFRPPPGSVVFGAAAGRNAVWLAARPDGRGLELRASVVDSAGTGVGGLAVRFTVDVGGGLYVQRGLACGAGCYAAHVRTLLRPVRFRLGVGASELAFPVPGAWPPQPARTLVLRAAARWRSLRTLVFRDELSAGIGEPVRATWRVAAPDRVSYRIEGGNQAVIVGDRRWDRSPGQAWRASPQVPVSQPQPPWAGVTNAHLLAERVRAGRRELVLSFFDPKSPAWFRIVVDRATYRTLDVRMIAAAHFMHEVYGPFDAKLSIAPPRAAG